MTRQGAISWLDRSGFGLLSPALLVLLAVFVAPLLVLLPRDVEDAGGDPRRPRGARC